MGNCKGIGNVYSPVCIDSYSRVANAKLYTEKTALIVADMLNDSVLPWYQDQSIPILRILTDRGTEYKGKIEHHACEWFLSIEGIEHTVTKAYSPQTNGFCERFNKTLKQDFFDTAMRKKIYTNLNEWQQDLDSWLDYITMNDPMLESFGKTPIQTGETSKKLVLEKNNQISYCKATSDTLNLTDNKNRLYCL